MLNEEEAHIEVQYALGAPGLPADSQIRRWAGAALQGLKRPAEVVIRIVDAAEMTALNRQYRNKDGPTNVLAFPCEPPPGVDTGLLGDVVICAPLVAEEAIAGQKSQEAHWAHLVIHGLLHLRGFDHQDASAAAVMEARETQLLGRLGYSDPYR